MDACFTMGEGSAAGVAPMRTVTSGSPARWTGRGRKGKGMGECTDSPWASSSRDGRLAGFILDRSMAGRALP